MAMHHGHQVDYHKIWCMSTWPLFLSKGVAAVSFLRWHCSCFGTRLVNNYSNASILNTVDMKINILIWFCSLNIEESD